MGSQGLNRPELPPVVALQGGGESSLHMRDCRRGMEYHREDVCVTNSCSHRQPSHRPRQHQEGQLLHRRLLREDEGARRRDDSGRTPRRG